MPKKEISNSARHWREELIYASIVGLSHHYTADNSYYNYARIIAQTYERKLFPRSREGNLVTKAS